MQAIYAIDKKTWNDFISQFDDPAILQSWEWGDLKSLHGWSPIRVAVYDNDKIVAAISILKRKLPYSNLNLFYAPRGPVLDFTNMGVLDCLLSEINKLAKRHKAVVLKIDPQIDEGRLDIVKILSDKGFVLYKKQIQPRSTFIIDLTLPLDRLLASFEEKTRYNVRLSAKKDVLVKELSTKEGVEIFYNLYKETAKRDTFLIHPVSYYKNIKKLLVDSNMSNVFIAYYNNVPIAGVWTFNFGNKIWYMYGASISSFKNVMPNHALHWHVMKWAKAKGFICYDLFGIPSNPNESHPLWGVYRFKKGFNGKLVKYVGVYEYVYKPFWNYIFNNLFAAYKNIRSLILKGKISDSLTE